MKLRESLTAIEMVNKIQLTTRPIVIPNASTLGVHRAREGREVAATRRLAGTRQIAQTTGIPSSKVPPLPIIAAATNPMIEVRTFAASIQSSALEKAIFF